MIFVENENVLILNNFRRGMGRAQTRLRPRARVKIFINIINNHLNIINIINKESTNIFSISNENHENDQGRRGILRLSVTKLARIDDPEAKLCRAVLINNTLR